MTSTRIRVAADESLVYARASQLNAVTLGGREPMGLSLEFYAGNADAIGAAFTEVEFDRLRDGTCALAYADLSLHVSPDDLDVLSQVVAERSSQSALLLLDSLTRTVGAIDEEGAAMVVDKPWVAMVARASVADAASISAEWIQRVGDACGEKLEPTEDAARAVGALISLCKKALDADVDVVHAWYL